MIRDFSDILFHIQLLLLILHRFCVYIPLYCTFVFVYYDIVLYCI